MNIGDSATCPRRFDTAALAEFARLTGHAGDRDCVPEPLIAAMFSYLLGVKLPGPGTNYLKQDMNFRAPAPAGADLVF